MSRIIVLTSGKGGVGKSSVSINIAYALSCKGNRVCLIDADFGLKNLDVMMGLENRVVYDLKDVISSKASINQVLVKDKRNDGLYLLPAYKSLSMEYINLDYMIKIIDELKSEFDYILIDSPAGIEKGFEYATKLSNEAIIVATLDLTSLRDADRVIGLLLKDGINEISLIINKYNEDYIKNGNCVSVKDACELLSIPLLGIIYDDVSMIESNNKGVPVYLHSNNLLKNCFDRIVRRMEGEVVPFVRYKKKSKLDEYFYKLFHKY